MQALRFDQRLLLSAAALTGFVVAMVGSANAHPHVWITVQSTVLYDHGSFVGIRHKWTFDEMYTAMAIQGLDTNHDGVYDRSELAELAKVNVEGLKEVGYFTQATLAGQALEFDEVRDYYLEYVEAPAEAGADAQSADTKPGQDAMSRMQGWDGGKPGPGAQKQIQLSLYFTLPLKQPILAEARGFSFSVADPTFFIAFQLAKANPVQFGPGAPAGCRAKIGVTEDDQRDAKRLGEALSKQPSLQGMTTGFGRPVTVRCSPKT